MKNFKVTFKHIDGSIRTVSIQAFNKERAILRFEVNWGNDMKITDVVSQDDIDNCRKEHTKLIGRYDSTNKRFPVIVDTFGAGCLGVQFWNESEVKKGILINTDRSTSTFIERL